MQAIARHFDFVGRKTTLGTEVRAGTVTFATMIYILIVQPMIMSACGMPAEAVFTATAICTALSTITMGLSANLPFALSTAMGTNAIMSYSIVGAGIATWEVAIGMIFWSGLLFVLLSIPIRFTWKGKAVNFCAREAIVQSIPVSLKLGLSAVIGVFLLDLGMGSSGINAGSVASRYIGDFSNEAVIAGVIGVIVVSILFFVKRKNGKALLPGAILVGIFAITVYLVARGISAPPTAIVSAPPSFVPILGQLKIFEAFRPQYFPYILVFFLGDFFSTAGTALGCGSKAGLMDSEGNIPKLNVVFIVDSAWTVAGSLFGLSTITTFVESASGVEEGGRTGFTSLVTAGLFLIALFLSPLFFMVPAAASGMALSVVGLSMIGILLGKEFRKTVIRENPLELIPIGFMLVWVLFTADFATALCWAVAISFAISLFRRYVKRDGTPAPNIYKFCLLAIAIAKFLTDALVAV